MSHHAALVLRLRERIHALLDEVQRLAEENAELRRELDEVTERERARSC